MNVYPTHTNRGFLLRETLLLAARLRQGATWDELEHDALHGDLLESRSVATRRTLFRALRERLEQAPSELLDLLDTQAQETKVLTVLCLILHGHPLLTELLLEAVRPAHLALQPQLKLADLTAWAAGKRLSELHLQRLTDATYGRTLSGLTSLLGQVGLLEREKGGFRIRAPFLPSALRHALLALGWSRERLALLDSHPLGTPL